MRAGVTASLEALVAPDLGAGVGQVIGALGFGIGVVFLVVGRTELFTENFFVRWRQPSRARASGDSSDACGS